LESRDVDGPLILDASETPPDLDSILSDIPPKDITSKLVSRYFNGVEFPTGKFLAVFALDCITDGDYSDHTHAHIRSGGVYINIRIFASS
jgi:hypothetical protein